MSLYLTFVRLEEDSAVSSDTSLGALGHEAQLSCYTAGLQESCCISLKVKETLLDKIIDENASPFPATTGVT